MDPEQQRSILSLEGDWLQQDAAPLHRPPDRAHLRISGGAVMLLIIPNYQKVKQKKNVLGPFRIFGYFRNT